MSLVPALAPTALYRSLFVLIVNVLSVRAQVSIGKTAIRPLDLPQSLTVIDRAIMDQQRVLRLTDRLHHTRRVYVPGTTGGTKKLREGVLPLAATIPLKNLHDHSTHATGLRFKALPISF